METGHRADRRTAQESMVGGRAGRRSAFRWILSMMVVTGFAQMPIFKRYYIADIPGLGWLADFHTTLVIHYLGAGLLMGLMAYALTRRLLNGRPAARTANPARLYFGLLYGVMASGLLMTAKNIGLVWIPPPGVVGLALAHLSLVMALLLAGAGMALFRVLRRPPAS